MADFDDLSGISSISSDEDQNLPANVDACNFVVGDFVIVQFEGKSKSYYHLAQIEGFDDDGDIEAKFLRKCGGNSRDENVYFTYSNKAVDECSVSTKDVVQKLPPPIAVGGTARRDKRVFFPCKLDKWNVE